MHCWARYFFFAVVLILGVGNIVTACGQKGDLYQVVETEKAEQRKAAEAGSPAPPQSDVPQPSAEPAQP